MFPLLSFSLSSTFIVVCSLSHPLATTITVLTPVSCYYMASFNYGGKKAKDVGLTCRCHLSNIVLIALANIPECKGSISPSSFYG